ncbi:Palmitoyltransferase [Caenorhabditis elegans]|uniref:Palmitoyltransferase n=1 Tax=Caenorhabditis elegans TaxID=6239 RepID=Q9TYQ6_CAEEL|nr:Palmitoyltransferase [Caenorhabditis elegans]CCD72482.2 Palmitoyltransferase [Caenorhabditis elegans]|eukprot:NP_500889.2 Palmitoyltransferase [Caenorhabditis elegans]
MPGRLSTIEEKTETSTGAISTTSNTTNSGAEMDSKMHQAVRACQIGEIQTVRFLLNGHVSANEFDHEGCGLLHWAAINNKLDIIQLLLSHRADINLIGGNMKSTPLHWACYNSQFGAVMALVKNGADPTIKNINGETPLHLAACTGNFIIIAYLLVKFDNIKDTRDNLGRSALMMAADKSFGLFPIRIFTKVDAYLDFTDDEKGNTALHILAARQNLKGVVELICSGADDTKTDNNGVSARDLMDNKFRNLVDKQVTARNICELGTICEKVTSRWFLGQFFTATISGVMIGAATGLYFLTNFWVVLGGLALTALLLFILVQRRQMDQFGCLPVTYIFWMGIAEFALLIFNSNGLVHWSVLIFVCSIWVISASFYWILILTNPGVLPRSTTPFKDFIKDLEEKQIDRYCFTCWIPKTSSSHHCSQCDKCVDGFDHHCPWIHKCVYRKNLRAFVFFCLTIFMFHVFYVLLLLYMIGASMNASGFEQTLNDHGLMVISLILAIPHVFGAGAITCTQFSQISRHVSTIEIIRKQRLQRNSSEKTITSPEHNPWEYKQSVKTRIRNVCNLLAFDKFGDGEEIDEGHGSSSFETSSSYF